MKMSFLCFQLALLFYVFSASDARLFSRVNCLVSSWTSWSEPNEYGQRIRTCTILRMPSGGGFPCPHIREVKGVKPSFTLILQEFTLSFVEDYDPISDDQIAKVRDIVFILDSSGSIGLTKFNKAKADAKSLFGTLCPFDKTFDMDYNNPYQHQQLAMLTYSTTIEENFFFNTYSKTADVLQAISQATYQGLMTNTAGAFKKARNMFQTSRGARDSTKVKREVLIVTDGLSNTGGDAVAAAKELSKVADVYGLMIGKFSAAGMTELTDYVSTPASKHLFNLDDFESLTLLVEALEINKRLHPDWCASLDQD
ncbi:collagen alpha-1(XII) chain-like [Mercenaria mercenaria]|uniref:collagen alpha-1(XII) chain-like n=1 Tax=Mercenaria mercenaria TaxID=6596 RepID=UPI00234F1B9D|nr:collagen alpha-1(XII) chain-like [Mercenaria mercenaria]